MNEPGTRKKAQQRGTVESGREEVEKEPGAPAAEFRKPQRQPKPAFNPTRHLTRIQGRDYLEVKWRLVWFRQDHPDWAIETQPWEINVEHRYAIYRACIKDEHGRVIATGTKVETQNGFADYLEKAETGAVGRALALCGYGTQFAPELGEGDRIVDGPVERERRAA